MKYKFKQKTTLIPWHEKIKKWKQKYPICDKRYFSEKKINPYVFIDSLSDVVKENTSIIVDTGCAIAWTMQGFKFKKIKYFFTILIILLWDGLYQQLLQQH